MKRKFIYSLSSLLNILIIFSFLNCSSEPIIKSKSLVSINFKIQGNGKVKPELGTYDINSRVVFKAQIQGIILIVGKDFEDLEQEEFEFVLTDDLNLTAIFLPIPELSSEIKIYNQKKLTSNHFYY